MVPITRPAERPANSHLLEDVVALTGLLSPERIWQKEEQLDELNESQARKAPPSVPSEPGLPAAD